MLDKLQIAIRRYEKIGPRCGTEMTRSQAEQLTEWLEFDVAEVTATLLTRPGFRRHARWPLERLTGETDCSERTAVLAVDDGLVRCARGLSNVARTPEVWKQLLRLGPYQEEVPEGDPRAIDEQSEQETSAPMPLGLRHVEFLMERPWRDLVSASDYFHPVAQFNLGEDESVQHGEFMSFLHERLRVPGDLVSRCMDIRIERWLSDLQRFWVRCDTARRSLGIDLQPQRDELAEIFPKLTGHYKDLQATCFQGEEARLRDSCIALLQIYVGFRQRADVDWLGPIAKLATNASDIPHRVAWRHEWDVPERAAQALIDVEDFVRRGQTPQELIEEMKATNRLVLIEEQREGFLDKNSINKSDQVNWHGRGSLQWELLWTLAEMACLGKSVDCYCLTNPNARRAKEPLSSEAVKNRRSDLRRLIVPELDTLIVAEGRGTYRLDLEPIDICLLGWFSEDRLVALPPAHPRPTHS